VPIFDQGYQHWSGHLSNHAWRWLAITRHGVRVAMKLPRLKRTLFVAWMPAIGLAAFLSVWGLIERGSNLVAPILPLLGFLNKEVLADPKHFRVEIWTLAYTYFMRVELWISMLLILLVGPNLISRDLRFNALPLYFSRPLRRFDYFLGKLGVIGALLGMVIVAPAVIAYILGMLFSLDITIIRDTFPILLATIAYGLLVVVSAGTLILALSSLSRNSRYIALLWAAFLLVTSAMSEILADIEQEPFRREVMMGVFQSYRQADDADSQQTLDRLDKRIVELQVRDWRPLVSYMENLQRIGRRLLGTDSSKETFRQLQPLERRVFFRLMHMNPEYPWYWSAGVLAVLFGLSVCILNFRIRSLDRLK
jgi:ABC-2 type transport system permease protein